MKGFADITLANQMPADTTPANMALANTTLANTTRAEKIILMAEGAEMSDLILEIQSIIQTQLNGRLYVHGQSGETWSLDFRVGRLVWASGGQHRFRRWQRSLRRFCPDLSPSSVQLREQGIFEHWEFLALSVMLKRQQISREDAVSLIEMTVLEVLFDILQAAPTIRELSHTVDRQSRVGEPIAILSNGALLACAQQSLLAWQALGMGKISPNQAPTLRNREALAQATSPKTYKTLCSLLQGRLSFRDLSVIMRHDLVTLGQSLVSYMHRDFISLISLADLESPYAGSSDRAPAAAIATLPLVYCVDDSPQVCYIMEETLRAAGYRCMSIQDSIQALPTLIRHKPSLIFLDLVMPVANGYEICSQIRRVGILRNTPVIILTGNDGVMDRVRAKAVGATDFMAKPVDPERVVHMVGRYVRQPD